VGGNGGAASAGGNGGKGGDAAGSGLAVIGGTVTVVSVTLAANVANVGIGANGGKGASGGLGAAGSFDLGFGANGADAPAGSAGPNGTDLADGVYSQGGTIQVLDSIFARNLNSSGGVDVSGAFTSLGHNLIGNGTGSSGFVNGQSGDLMGTSSNPIDPKFGPLQNNGGTTVTLALQAGSPARQAGTAATAGTVTPPTTDQRGVSRKVSPDIGAFEVPATTTALSSSANPSVFGQAVTITATVTSASGTPTGTVVFKEGSTTLGTETLNNGVATLSLSTLGVGTHTITAIYSGDSNFTAGTPGTLTQKVMVIITLGPTTLSATQAGASYKQTLTASGGTSPYTYKLTSGALPPGLVLSSTGILSGRPTRSGTFTWTVQATDKNGRTGPHTYTLTVHAGFADRLTYPSQPNSGHVDHFLAPFAVEVLDKFGNRVDAPVSLTLVVVKNGLHAKFGPGSVTRLTAVNGVATFSKVSITVKGTYRLVAHVGSLTVESSSFTVG
jgi:hypothetical protein